MRTLRLQSLLTVFVLSCCLYGFVPAPSAIADIQYVSDLLIISIREGQSPEAPVVGYLPSAASVEVLEETQYFMRIRTEDGIQGWVRKKFIVKDKPKAIIIKELEEQLAQLKEDINTLQQGSDTQVLINTINEYKKQVTTLTTSLENEKKTTLTLKKNLQQVNTAHQALEKKHKNTAATIKELATIKTENQVLKDKIAAMPPIDSNSMLSGSMKWFLIGGGVVLFGFIIGRSAKRSRTHRY